MAAHPPTMRRGLPRQRGGDAWPSVGEEPDEVLAAAPDTSAPAAAPVETTTAASMPVAPVVVAPTSDLRLRRGLPRVAGGRPWPEAGEAPTAASLEATDAATAAVAASMSVGDSTEPTAAPKPAAREPAPVAAPAVSSGRALRRGLPRV